MCRHLAYIGAPITLADAVYGGDHSLRHQASEPRELLSGKVCADGFGVGWYTGGAAARYRSVMPIWSDTNLPELGAVVESDLIVASVRHATPGMAFGEAAVHPLRHERWLFMHNGAVYDPGGRLRAELRALAPSEAPLTGTDTGELFGALLTDLLEDLDPAAALRKLCQRVAAYKVRAFLNLALADGERILLTRFGTDAEQPSLYLDTGENAVRVASEPLDDSPGWTSVPPSTLVSVDRGLAPVLSEIGA